MKKKKYDDIYPTTNPEYHIVQKGSRFGVISTITGKIVIPIRYDKISIEFPYPYVYTPILVYKDGFYGYVDIHGVEVIPPQYKDALPFRNGFASVQLNCYPPYWGVINKDGGIVIPFEYECILDNSPNGLWPAQKNGLWGYIDVFNKAIIDFQYDKALPFSEDVAVVYKNNKAGYIDKFNHVIIDFKYAKAYSFFNRVAKVVDETGTHKWITLQGLEFPNAAEATKMAISYASLIQQVEQQKAFFKEVGK